MPMPESYTLNRNVLCVLVSSSSSTSTYTWPVLVNLMALDSRLSRIWRRRSGSPMTSVRVSGPMKEHISSPLLSARDATESTASSMTPRTSKSTHTSSSFPASTLVRSRMSLMSSSSDCDEMRICSVNLRCSAVRAVSMTSWFMPMMTLSGVRISCDMVARNCDLASLAACAWNSSFSCFMRRRISVMSCPTPITPTILPSTPRFDVTLSKMSIRLLSASSHPLVITCISKFDVPRPSSALRRTSDTWSWKSGSIRTFTNSFPMTISLVRPEICADC
mmetsp:Transcript_7333/g.22431  ORF Transcript_7333/g.22431 Transcript_7333/m.22431 type:complete len:277 (+) Transcript_7333:295-1125(+)